MEDRHVKELSKSINALGDNCKAAAYVLGMYLLASIYFYHWLTH